MNNEITNKINLVMIIIGLFLGLTVGIFLLFTKSDKSKANVYLGILVLLSLVYFLPGFLFRFDLLERFPHVLGFPKNMNLLIGPLTYLYVRACTQKNYTMKPILWLHFLPFVLFTIYLFPVFFQSGELKVEEFYRAVIHRDMGTKTFNLIFQTIHILVYFGMSLQLIFKYKNHVLNSASSIDRSFFNWVLVFIGIHGVPAICMIIAYVFSSFGQFTFMVVLFSFFLFSFVVYLAIMIKPELFHSFPHQMLIPESTESKTQKYESSNLRNDQKEVYTKRLIQHVELNKPYLESELTLSQLSEQTNIPAHYVSQVINEKLDCNFLEFINGYRIEEAKERLGDPKFDHYTVVGIALEVGFNSKSAFYSAFKKLVGATPSSYRKSLAVPA